MSTLTQVEACTNDVANAAKDFADQCRLGYSTSSTEVARTRRNLLALVARLQVLLFQPTDFLQHLATQVAHLAPCSLFLRVLTPDLYRPKSSRVSNG